MVSQEPSTDAETAETPDVEAPVAGAEEAGQDAAPDATVPAPVGTGECGEFCAEIAGLVTNQIVGQDGTVWAQPRGWETADQDGLDDVETTVGEYSSSVGSVVFTVWRFADDAAADAAFAALSDARGSAVDSGAVYESGEGMCNSYEDAESTSILWTVTGDGTQPWVMLVDGPDNAAVFQFYLSLPI